MNDEIKLVMLTVELAEANKKLKDDLAAANKRIAELEQVSAPDAKDAERYRWLRLSKSNPAYCSRSTEWGVQMIGNDALDAVIDDAMAKGVQS